MIQQTIERGEREPGYCQCGCGRTLPPDRPYRWSGKAQRFLLNHGLRGARNGRWKGGRQIRGHYVLVWCPGHPEAHNGHVFEHRLIAEAALGKRLAKPAVIHHHRRDDPRAIVICQDDAYHVLLEYRTRALRESGHADWWRCKYCKEWDDPARMRRVSAGCRVVRYHRYHRVCHNRHQRERRHRLQAKGTPNVS